MFVRPEWKMDDQAAIRDLIDRHPLAVLVSSEAQGPLATSCPLLLDPARGPNGTLVGHMARANPHWRSLEAAPQVLAMFTGPEGYVSPAWYPKRDMAPTWYYCAVHCYGRVRLIDDEPTLRASLDTLVARMEHGRQLPWCAAELGEAGIARRLKQIVGFEIAIERVVAKFKLGQDEPLPDALAAAAQMPADKACLRELVEHHNAQRPSH
jgi:transcriptional regulator